MKADSYSVPLPVWSRIFHGTVPTPLACSYIISLCVLYIFVYTHMPINIYFMPHDDTLYIKLGNYLAQGRWLGPYDQFTLMKGPGYPFFLAAANWLRIPITWAHAVFHCAAVVIFVLICHRFIRHALVSGILFTLLLWQPILLIGFLLRVIRDAVYPDQILLFLAFAMLALFCVSDAKRRLWSGITSGLLLGWIWLTREEGIWLLPGIAVLAGGAAVRAFQIKRLKTLAANVCMIVVAFGVMQVAFGVANKIAYGKFVGVDFKEKNFQRALQAIHSVISGGTRHYVSVTTSARQQIYRVSPTFASLSRYLDVPEDQGWASISCAAIPVTCGEIGSGWFMWALRGAADAAGQYSSPARAATFFGLIADEIDGACARGDLQCEPQLVPEMPHVTWADYAQLPSLYLDSLNYLLLLNPPQQLGNSSSGNEMLFTALLKFLNYPLYTPRDGELSQAVSYTISGWYHKSARDWLWATVKDATGHTVESHFERRASPDLAITSPGAIDQRFMLQTRCSDECTLQLETPEGVRIERRFSELRGRSMFAVPVGPGTFYVESASVGPDLASVPRLADRIALSIRKRVLIYYPYALVPALILGAIGFLLSSLIYWRNAYVNVCYLIALACWLLVFVRLSLLVLITATSMYSLHGTYHGPANFLMVVATLMSIAAWLQLSTGSSHKETAPV